MFRASSVVMLAGLCAVAGLGATAGSAQGGTSFSFSIGSGFGGCGPRYGFGFSSYGGYGRAYYPAPRVYCPPVAYCPPPVVYCPPPVTYCPPPVVYVRPGYSGSYGYTGYSGYRGHRGYPAHRGYSNFRGHSGLGIGVSVGSAQTEYQPAPEPVSTPERPYYGAASSGEGQRFTSNFQSEPQRVEPIRAETVRAVAATQPSGWRAGTGLTPARSSSDVVMRSLAQNASGRNERGAPAASVQPVSRVMPLASAAPVAPVRTLSAGAALPAKTPAAPSAGVPAAKPAPATVTSPATTQGGPARYVAAGR